MPGGSCLCGNVKYEYSGEPVQQATCHCLACRKISGGTNSFTIAVPEGNFRFVSGTPKRVLAKQETGLNMDISFCGDCGITLAKTADGPFTGLRIIFCGTLDDNETLQALKPQAEFFVKHRMSWVPEVPTVAQMQEFT